MRCIECDAAEVSERPERTAQGYRRFRCRACGKQFNERSGGILNRAQYPSDAAMPSTFPQAREHTSFGSSLRRRTGFLISSASVPRGQRSGGGLIAVHEALSSLSQNSGNGVGVDFGAKCDFDNLGCSPAHV